MDTTASTLGRLLARQNDYQCQSDFATDYYGLGVRLGIYFAWLGSWLANTMLPSEFSGAADTTCIFIIVMLIAMTNDSRTGQLTSIDGLTLMHLCGGTVFGVLSVWGYRTRLYFDEGPKAVRKFGGFGTHVRLAASLCLSVFGLWFWLYGVTQDGLKVLGPDDGVEPPNPAECSILYTFFFAKVRADGGIRFYYAVVCAMCTLYFGIMFIVSLIAGIASARKIRSLANFFNWGSVNRNRYATGFTHTELRYLFLVLRVGNLVWLLFSATTVEVTLNFNDVHGVLGGKHDGGLQLPSQLLPFLIGMFSFLRIMYQLLREFFSKKEGDLEASRKKKNDDTDEVERHVFVVPESELVPGTVVPGKQGAGLVLLPRSNSYHIVARSLMVRYLVGWLPWLGLVVHPDTAKRSRMSTLIERSTGLSAVSPTGPAQSARHSEFEYQGWTAPQQASPFSFTRASSDGQV
ncbi:hypothetical protein B0T18DRAFT_200477 [Schizothecium vesticola]|uniref:Uncharacterized protein n=1 Tax=Schizothecium vesticola TaxID=314040 RepID=A0AA40ERP4_9PEZI|nr:hypothetical protein B0T18DRAFT_200477 [Schizothecium vesticola]